MNYFASPDIDKNRSIVAFCACAGATHSIMQIRDSPYWSLSPNDVTLTLDLARCVQGYVMGSMAIGLWRPIHVSMLLRFSVEGL